MQESSHRQEQFNRLEIYMLELAKRLLAAFEAMRVVEGAETMKFHGINHIGNVKAE
jgi:DNA repair protein RadC